MTAAVGLVVIVTVAVAFAAVYRQTDTQLRSQLDTQIRTSARQLATAMTSGAASSGATVLNRARLYIADQPFRNAAVLLFAVVPGHGTASNHAELVTTQRPDSDETQAEQDRENAEALAIRNAGPGFSTVTGPDVGRLRIYQQPLSIAGGLRLYAGAGEPLTGVGDALHGVATSFILAGSLTLVLTLALSFLLGTRISRPLRDSAAVAARVDAGDLTPRLDVGLNASEELYVLADAFNRMLDRLAVAFAGQRAFVADASHELRTPLTVMRGQLDLLAAAGADAQAGRGGSVSPQELQRVTQLVQAEIGRITRLTDDLLLLMQSDQDHFLHIEEVELSSFITDLWDGLSLVAERDFQLGEIPQISLAADPDRLAQALRNVALNAVNHTEPPGGRVRLDVQTTPGGLTILISDDGPGIPEPDRVRVFERFVRTDPARSRARGGAGLGLSICQAIVQAHGGSVTVDDSPLGGARFRITLPN